MKILQVHPTYTSIKGGVERHIEGLSKYLSERGHYIDILTIEDGSDLVFEQEHIIVKRKKKTTFFTWEPYDVVHVHGYRVPWANLFGLLSKLGRNHVVMTTHGIYPPRSTIDLLTKQLYDHSLGRVNLKIFDAFIALTPETMDALLRLGAQREKIQIIPNAIDTERFKKIPKAEIFLRNYELSSDIKLVLYVGRIDWNKGLDLALRSFSFVVKRVPNALFAIMGQDSGYCEWLKNLAIKLGISDKVLFTGKVTEEMLFSAYASADVLLLPSVYEGLPTVVLEAMACGVPVVACRTGGTVYAIEHGKTGFLVDYGDCTGIAKQLELILSDKELKTKIVKNGKSLVEDRFSWATNAEKIEQLYRLVI
jgi:glycosyltransferase involved in cell wall biosynthesis